MRQTSVARLFDHYRERLQLTWVAGSRDAVISFTERNVIPADLVGYLNLIHPDRLQVLGASEMVWAARQPYAKLQHHLAEITAAGPPAVVVADGCVWPDVVTEACATHDIPLLSSPMPAATVIELIRAYLARQLADTTTIHGVLMDVLGLGVLITGESGVGKSELALELISRGHGLVADDVVEVSRIAPDALEGRCPDLLLDFLEVRGLGVLNIRTVFGETACRRKMRVRLLVHLQRPVIGVPEATRLPLDAQTEKILGVDVRRVIIPVAAGRNLAVLLEAAVRSTILIFRGIDSTLEFADRQRRLMDPGGT